MAGSTSCGTPADFFAFEWSHAVSLQALEEEQPRIVAAPFEFVADVADLLQVAVRVRDENPCTLSG
ncbi:MAG TPA: hypothetical protein VGX03_34535 [Candidatus Binatia bacterium]|nr:hypothetical protein [Candidatus Binatia bacterium]